MLRFILGLSGALLVQASVMAGGDDWLAGTAKINITPDKPMWMAGYGNRDRAAEGKLSDLWVRALVIQDEQGRRGVVLTTDLLGIPKSIYENTCAALKQRFGLTRAQIMLNCSHTHCGPVLRGALYDIYPLNEPQVQLIEEYSTQLEQKIVAAVAGALESMRPARLFRGQGVAGFAVNRRNNLEPEVPKLREQGLLRGPVDHSVPVLAVRSPDGSLRAVVFGYACHNTTLSFYQWCGDYAGFAQTALEDDHPGTVAMFFMGCGADQNPLPRRQVELCRHYGDSLARSVNEVLEVPMAPIVSKIQTQFCFVDLNLGTPLTRERLAELARTESSYIQRWARRLSGTLDSGQPFLRTYPYPVQVWKLGPNQLWVTLGGEVVVDYSLRLKEQYGLETWVTGYANDVMAYIPSLRVLREDTPPRASPRWGYEGNTSMMVYGLPAERWGEDIEEIIVGGVHSLVQKLE